jgi:hypothetical protein
MNPASRHLHTLDLNVDELFSSGNLILVHEKGEKQEPPIDGSFMLQLLINEFCAKTGQMGQPAHSHVPATVPDKKILLVLTHQTEKHWSQCCSKLGQNLESLKKSGSLTVIDTLKLEYDALNPNHDSTKTEEPFSGLIDHCKSAIDSLCIPSSQTVETKPHLLVIIENLTSLFLSQDDSSANTLNAMEFLRILRTYRQQELDACVATLVKSNIHDQSWVNSSSCQAHGNYMANLVTECFDATIFEVCPLSTGYSDEIHGLLNIKPRNKSYHFKIEDRTVTFVAT